VNELEKEAKQRRFNAKRVRYAERLAKQLNTRGDNWHERAGECCSYSDETIGHHMTMTSFVVEFYNKVTLIHDLWVNVKVCYRIPGMSGYEHMDLIIPKAEASQFTIADRVRMLKNTALNAFRYTLGAASVTYCDRCGKAENINEYGSFTTKAHTCAAIVPERYQLTAGK
jgi:hypothetical protein